MTITFHGYAVHAQERYIISIEVPRSPIRPVVLQYDGVPSIFMRREGYTNGATYEEIIRMGRESSPIQYDTVTSVKTYDRGRFSKLLAFFSSHNEGKELTDKALQSIGFFDKEHHLRNRALLFEDGYEGGKTLVQCSLFSGTNKGSGRIVTVNRFSGNLIESIGFCSEFVFQRMNHSIIKYAQEHKTVDAYPARALFEGIINAIAHRDYYLDGTQIQIDMYADRIEISSPGSFYQGGRIEKTYDLSSLISQRRNELICQVFVKCNVMEAAGTGFDKIAEEYADADQTHKPYICAASNHFTLVLPDLTFADGVADSSCPYLGFMPSPHATSHDGKVLSFCYARARKAKEIASYLSVADSSYLRKRVLANLVDNAYLVQDMVDGVSYYRTNREMVTLQ